MKLVLLAHQDDEIFLLPFLIGDEKKLLVYFTNGVSADANSSMLYKRTDEARATFEKYIAKFNSEVIWWGTDHSIPEGELHKHVDRRLIKEILNEIENSKWNFTEVVTTTFEGAHQDHDSVAVIARTIAKNVNLTLSEISTYPQWHPRLYSFKMLSPKHPDRRVPIKRFKVLRLALKLMWSYKSQRRTWIGLGLPILWAYGLLPYRTSMPYEVGKIGSCLYEFRKRREQSEVLGHLLATTDFEDY